MGTTAQEGYAYIAWDSTTEPPASMVAEADARTADFGCAALVEVECVHLLRRETFFFGMKDHLSKG